MYAISIPGLQILTRSQYLQIRRFVLFCESFSKPCAQVVLAQRACAFVRTNLVDLSERSYRCTDAQIIRYSISHDLAYLAIVLILVDCGGKLNPPPSEN